MAGLFLSINIPSQFDMYKSFNNVSATMTETTSASITTTSGGVLIARLSADPKSQFHKDLFFLGYFWY